MANKIKKGTITTSTGTVVAPLSSDNPLVVFQFSGTYGGLTVNLEGSVDGTNYFAIDAAKSTTYTSVYGAITLTDNSTVAFVAPVAAYTHVRVRASAYTSGTLNVTIVNTKGEFAAQEPAVYQLTNSNVARATVAAAAGTGTADLNIVTGSGILHRFFSTTVGSAACSIYDGLTSSGGTLLYTTGTATPAVGTGVELNIPFSVGLTIAQASGSLAGTFYYSLT